MKIILLENREFDNLLIFMYKIFKKKTIFKISTFEQQSNQYFSREFS